MSAAYLRAVEGGVELEVLVVPRSSRNQIAGEHDGRLKVQLNAPPVEGEANAALVQLLQPGPRLVLAPPPAQGRATQAHQRRRVKRPFKEADVAERLEETLRRRVALEAAASAGKQNEGEVGPLRLRLQPRRQRPQIRAVQRFLRNNAKTGARIELVHQSGDRRA